MADVRKRLAVRLSLLVWLRAEGILNRGNVDAFALEESQNLSIFFATNNSITIMLKKALEEVGVAVAFLSLVFIRIRSLSLTLPPLNKSIEGIINFSESTLVRAL